MQNEHRREDHEEITPEKRESFMAEMEANLREFRKATDDEWDGMAVVGIGPEKVNPEEGGMGRQCFAQFCMSPEGVAHMITVLCRGGDEIVDAVFLGLMNCAERREHILQRLMMTVSHLAMLMQMMPSMLQAMAQGKGEQDEPEPQDGTLDAEPEPTHTIEDLMGMFAQPDTAEDGEKDKDDGKDAGD